MNNNPALKRNKIIKNMLGSFPKSGRVSVTFLTPPLAIYSAKANDSVKKIMA